MNSTDQVPGAATAELGALSNGGAARVLAGVADHFTTADPTAVLEHHSLLICVGAEAYELADRSVSGDGQAMSKAAMAALPEFREGITRGEFALLIRAALAEVGHEWTEDDNRRVIPEIPGPRQDPKPTVPTQPTSKAG
jgi:hypothetical protein